MASLDSANGPSATVRPFLPDTTLPSCSSGWPALAFPSCISRSNQPMNWLVTFWISSGESPLSQCVPRKISRYSDLLFSVLIIWFSVLGSYCWRSLGIRVTLPEPEHVIFRVLANGEITHLRHGRFRHADFPAELLHFGRELVHRRDADIMRDALLPRILPLHQSAIGRRIGAAGVHMPILHWPGKLLRFPPEERSIE